MKSLTVSNIKEYVKARLDELSNNEDASLVSGDGAVEDLDAIIGKVIVPAVRKMHLDAPNILLKGGVTLTETSGQQGEIVLTKTLIGSTGLYMVSFALPVDFLRLITFKLSQMERPIQTLIGEDSAEYRKQQNPYLMGTPKRPVGFLTHKSAYGKVEVYSIDTNSNVAISAGEYVPEPAIVSDAVKIIETLEYPCLEKITAETLRSIGKHHEAALFDHLAVEPFRIDPDWARMNPPSSERINQQQ